MPDNHLLRAALQYQAAGWHVVPLHWVADGICSCRKGADCASPGNPEARFRAPLVSLVFEERTNTVYCVPAGVLKSPK